jgi:hypothetical protein
MVQCRVPDGGSKAHPMSDRILLTILIILVVLAILSLHIFLSAKIWKRYSGPAALSRIAGLSLLTYCVWALAGTPIGFYVNFDHLNPPKDDLNIMYNVFQYTLGLRFADLCEIFPGLHRLGGLMCLIVEAVISFAFFFSLGLLPSIFIRENRQFRVQ